MNTLLEQDRKVVDDRIAPSHLLHKLTRYSQHHSPEMLCLSACEYSLQRCPLASRVSRGADTVQDDLFLKLGLFIVYFQSTKGRDDGFPFGVALAG